MKNKERVKARDGRMDRLHMVSLTMIKIPSQLMIDDDDFYFSFCVWPEARIMKEVGRECQNPALCLRQ